jgi:hypothetical protein
MKTYQVHHHEYDHIKREEHLADKVWRLLLITIIAMLLFVGT